MSLTTSPIILPRITIQPTFLEVINDIKQGLHAAEDSWISIYSEDFEGKESIHGRVRITENDDDEVEGNGSGGKVDFKGRDGVVVVGVSNTEFEISTSPSSKSKIKIPPTPIHFPLTTPYSLRQGITAFDISTSGTKFLVGGKDGIVRVGDLRNGSSSANVKELRAHVGDIKDVKFFPSGEVVLTSSIDMSLRIFAVEDASNVRTLLGHSATVTSTHIHKKGRLVISSAMDGTVRIWNVGSGLAVDVIRFTLPITYMMIGSLPSSDLGEEMEVDVETEGDEENLEGRIAILGHSNGSATIYSFPSTPSSTSTITSIANSSTPPTNLITLKTNSSSPITTIAYDSKSGLILMGSREGTISVFDISSISSSNFSASSTPELPKEDLKPLGRFRRSDSEITSIAFSSFIPSTTSIPTRSILIASADGLPYRISPELLPPSTQAEEGENRIKVIVLEEFAGMDCDSVIVRNGNSRGEVWVGGIDGGLRRYVSSRY